MERLFERYSFTAACDFPFGSGLPPSTRTGVVSGRSPQSLGHDEVMIDSRTNGVLSAPSGLGCPYGEAYHRLGLSRKLAVDCQVSGTREQPTGST